MAIPLAPPAVHAIDGVMYRFASPIGEHRAGWTVGALLAALLLSGGTGLGLLLVVFGLALAGWTTDRSVDLVVGLHRLEVRTTRLGLFPQTIAVAWHDLAEASLLGREIVVHRRDHAPALRVPAWAPIPQLAWVVGEMNAQIRRASTPQLADQAAFDLARLDQLVVASGRRP